MRACPNSDRPTEQPLRFPVFKLHSITEFRTWVPPKLKLEIQFKSNDIPRFPFMENPEIIAAFYRIKFTAIQSNAVFFAPIWNPQSKGERLGLCRSDLYMNDRIPGIVCDLFNANGIARRKCRFDGAWPIIIQHQSRRILHNSPL